MKTFTSQW